jgi:hypothetical protein
LLSQKRSKLQRHGNCDRSTRVHSKFFQSDWSSDQEDEKPSGFFNAIFSALNKNYRIFPKKISHAEIFS